MAGNGEAVKVARLGAYVMYRWEKQDAGAKRVPVAMAFADSVEAAMKVNATPGVVAVAVEDAPTEDIVRVGMVALVGIVGGLMEMLKNVQMAAAAASAAEAIDARMGPRRS